jgi:hypothetical protein
MHMCSKRPNLTVHTQCAGAEMITLSGRSWLCSQKGIVDTSNEMDNMT